MLRLVVLIRTNTLIFDAVNGTGPLHDTNICIVSLCKITNAYSFIYFWSFGFLVFIDTLQLSAPQSTTMLGEK
jgi:hypothetical protein